MGRIYEQMGHVYHMMNHYSKAKINTHLLSPRKIAKIKKVTESHSNLIKL